MRVFEEMVDKGNEAEDRASRGRMYPLRSDEEEVADFNRWLLYREAHGAPPSILKVDKHRFPTHYSGHGPMVCVSPEFKALLDRHSVKVCR